jgi:crossover junction endodeoxyribonuclease RuvC
MIVLGIDPGTAITGWGVVRAEANDRPTLVDCGTIQTTASTPLPQRLRLIFQQVTDLLERHGPETVAVEEVFFSKNVRTAMSVGQARGVILLAAALADRPVHEYTPLQVKQAISGYGGADKTQVQQMTALLLGLEAVPTPDDAADAIAVAICHLNSAHLQSLLAQQT